MTSATKALATLMIAAASMTGLAACGDDAVKVSSSEFLTKCKKEVDKNAQAKAYSADICGCVQDKLKEKGLGDEDENSSKAADEARTVTPDCTREAITKG